MAENICPVCHSEADVKMLGALERETEVTCPCCGHYVITEEVENQMDKIRDMVASWLYYHAKYNSEEKRFTSLFYISENDMGTTDQRYITVEEISNWYPKTFNEKVDRFLLMLANKKPYLGEMELFHPEQIVSALFAKFSFDADKGQLTVGCDKQCAMFFDYFHEKKYITDDSHPQRVTLSPYGWQRVDELQKFTSHNKEVFVSMAFNDGTNQTREAIRDGIIDAGYSPEFIDEIIHNHQIMPEMFRLIRECRFLIMDVSDPNYGAYYEAGYALGLGKEVIISCKEEVFTKKYETEEEKRLEKYIKPHFDIAQKQLLIWKDYEDLTHKLSEWIKAIVG